MQPDNNKFSLLPWQAKSAKDLTKALVDGFGMLLVGPCRTGKTYAVADAIVKAQATDGFMSRSVGPMNGICLTMKTIKLQTTRVLAKAGVKSVFIDSIDAFARGSRGEIFIEWVSKLVKGELELLPVWKEEMKPYWIWIDESQGCKNPSSLRAKIVKAAIEQEIIVILSSATPFAKICHAKIVCLATGLADDYSWPRFSERIAGGSAPDEYNSAAIKRLNDKLAEAGRLTKFENITYAHRTMNQCIKIGLTTAKKQSYDNAWLDYLEECRKNNKHTPEGVRQRWVAMGKFRQRAELLRIDELADEGIKQYNLGRQVIIGSNYVETLRGVYKCLITRGVPKDKIGYIVGSLSEKQRQEFVDKFQRNEIDFIIGTLKAGGVGISLHHEFECALPRAVILPPTWSPIELVQMLGRAHGPTSLSTTHQYVLWFKDTIEEEVADRVKEGFSSLKEIVTKRETWTDLFIPPEDREDGNYTKQIKNLLEEEQADKDEDGEEIIYEIPD